MALIEAMALGTAVVSVDCKTGPREIIDDPGIGLLVEENEVALAQGITRLALDPNLRDALAKGAERAVIRYSADSIVPTYERLLSGLIHSRDGE